MDFLYAAVDFSGSGFCAYRSVSEGDGGLTPGRLVFAEDIERFSGKAYSAALAEITGEAVPDSRSIGGPSIVSLIHTAQALYGKGHKVRYYGARGTDATGAMLGAALAGLPLDCSGLTVREGLTARTDVLSDPRYDCGRGERTFIHLPGESSFFAPENIEDSFFDAHITTFGGTALLPRIHDGLTALLMRARRNGAVTAVNLVYDYRHERRFPGQKWNLGAHDDAYPFIDILIADRDEALKTSGQSSAEGAVRWFLAQGTGAVIVTHGPQPVVFAAGNGLFAPLAIQYLPVYADMSAGVSGDTTGCGDNFAGGILAALAERVPFSRGTADLREVCVPGVIAGGFARFTLGGVFYETYPGEKQERIAAYTAAYLRSLRG